MACSPTERAEALISGLHAFLRVGNSPLPAHPNSTPLPAHPNSAPIPAHPNSALLPPHPNSRRSAPLPAHPNSALLQPWWRNGSMANNPKPAPLPLLCEMKPYAHNGTQTPRSRRHTRMSHTQLCPAYRRVLHVCLLPHLFLTGSFSCALRYLSICPSFLLAFLRVIFVAHLCWVLSHLSPLPGWRREEAG